MHRIGRREWQHEDRIAGRVHIEGSPHAHPSRRPAETGYQKDPAAERVQCGVDDQTGRAGQLSHRANRRHARPVSSLVSAPIPATNGADSPFLSPNGDEVAFYRSNPNALHLVSLRGGPRRSLATDSTVALGGDWGPDGAIYFTRVNGIGRLPAGDGPVEEVTRLDKPSSDVAHAWVDVLPNGKAALFTITRATSRLYDIAEGGLFAVSFDENSLTTNGAVIPIAAGLPIGANGMGSFVRSADGTLLYGTGAATESQLLVWVDRTGNEQVIDSAPGVRYGSLALSPNGRRVAMDVNSPSPILTKDLEGGPTSILTTDGSNIHPSWSVDGRFVRFTRTAPSGPVGSVQRRADGSAATEQAVAVSASVANRKSRRYVVSPNGEWAVFELHDDSQQLASLMAQRLNGDTTAISVGAPSPTTRHVAPRVSPDGRWLAYVSTEGEGAKPEVAVTPFPNTTTSRVQVSVSGGVEPLWSRDGRELFYTDSDGFLLSARIATTPDFRVANRTRLFNRERYPYAISGLPYYDISPVGTRFIMSRPARSANSERLVVVLSLSARTPAPASRSFTTPKQVRRSKCRPSTTSITGGKRRVGSCWRSSQSGSVTSTTSSRPSLPTRPKTDRLPALFWPRSPVKHGATSMAPCATRDSCTTPIRPA
ncbi:hypothetical protein [Gemmatimonas sp.]|uniref:hypothetical protein n=1 Tax=Gemmatimonas sp. TaxID=1962908 RepID=UPI0039837800